jgi:hypothetical protein
MGCGPIADYCGNDMEMMELKWIGFVSLRCIYIS